MQNRIQAQWVCSRERRIALYKRSSIINQSINHHNHHHHHHHHHHLPTWSVWSVPCRKTRRPLLLSNATSVVPRGTITLRPSSKDCAVCTARPCKDSIIQWLYHLHHSALWRQPHVISPPSAPLGPVKITSFSDSTICTARPCEDILTQQLYHLHLDCRKMTALENEVVFVVTNWVSEDTSKSTEELEFLSCCLLTVTTVARQYFHAVWNFDFCTHSVIKSVQCGISVLKWLVFLLWHGLHGTYELLHPGFGFVFYDWITVA